MRNRRHLPLSAAAVAVAAFSALTGCTATTPATTPATAPAPPAVSARHRPAGHRHPGVVTRTPHPTGHHLPTGPTSHPSPSTGRGPAVPPTRPAAPTRPSATADPARHPTVHPVRHPRHPNILMITADDAAPGDLKYMPLTEKLLASRGVTFTDAVAPTPICVPARASLLTGQYAHNHDAVTISGRGGGVQAFDNHNTLPVWLQRAGYDTLFIGKYLNGYGEHNDPAAWETVEPGWTQWRATSEGSTYNFTHPVLNINGTLHSYHEYNSTLFEQQTKLLLQAPQRHRKPWYLWVNYVAPHKGGPTEAGDPQTLYPHDPGAWIPTTHPAPRDKGRFAGLQLPAIPDMFTTVPGEPSDGRPMSPLKQRMVRIGFEQRMEALQSVDRGVAKTIRVLRRTHQLANTYIVFASDNGFLTGQHDRYGKLIHFDDSERIPMIWSGPGIPHGKTVATAVTNPDVATTIAAIAHARPGRPQDGVNMLPWVTRTYRDRIIPVEAYPVHGGLRPVYTGIREGTWTYVRFHRHGGFEEMYNRATDPYELHNLALDPSYRPQLDRFRKLNRLYRHCAGDTCPKQFLKPAQVPLLYGPMSRLGF